MVLTQFKTPIKVFRIDNGLEFATASFYASKGIIQQLSCVETRQQNVVVERKHQHLLSVSRALRFQINLPLKFWGDCVLIATYLKNRLPSPLLHDFTPYEKLLGHPPSYDQLKSFGCLCYASTLNRNKAKFDPKAKAFIFLGYPFGTKGYKLYDLATKSSFLSRDVIFKESIFPFKDWLSKSTPISLPISHSTFPCQPLIPDVAEFFGPFVSSEFSPPLTSVDITVPLDEFPDFVHIDLVTFDPNPDPDLDPDPNPISSSLPVVPAVRRSTRPHKPPTYLHDYHYNLAFAHVLATASLT